MLGSLPALAFLATAGAVHTRLASRGRRDPLLRESLLAAAVLCAAWLVLGTELLGLARLIAFWPVLLWWLVLAAAAAWDLSRSRLARRPIALRAPPLEPVTALLAAAVAALLALTLCQALLSPPNNSDSLSYHLQRQVYWMQQGSVSHYATSIFRQVVMPPLSEFMGLHLMILSGGDAWHNSVQWAALVLTALAASLLTRRLRGSAAAQLLCALLIIAAPPVFLQASNTKNDILVALFACAAAHWTLELSDDPSPGGLNVLLLGLAFGAMALTKGTGVLVGLPIGAMAAWTFLRRGGRRGIGRVLAMSALALGLNAGHYARNLDAFGSLDPGRSGLDAVSPLDRTVTRLLTPAGFASSAVKTLAMQCAVPSPGFNAAVTEAVVRFHRLIGLGVNDPRTTSASGLFRPLTPAFQRDEDTAGAPFHLLLLLLLPAALAAAGRTLPRRATAALLFFSLAACVLICAVVIWSRFYSRYFIPVVPLLAPVLAAAWASPRLARAIPLIVAGLLAVLAPSLQSVQRPLFGARSVFLAAPEDLRCYSAAALCEPARALAAAIEGLRVPSVGFDTGWSSEDYIVQRLLLDRMAPPPRFTAFNGAFQPRGRLEPDPAVLLARSDAPRLRHGSTGTWYSARARAAPYTLYLPDSGR